MALDEAMLDFVANSDAPECSGILRFYDWLRPTVSFGRFQRVDARCDLECARNHSVDMVRRPTGGKALLHCHEVTYCIALPASSALSTCSIEQSHQILARAVAQALELFGVDATVARPDGSGIRELAVPCFSEHLGESVVVEGRKVSGAAQMRRRGAVLQHGSILLDIDYELHASLFGFGRSSASVRRSFSRWAVGLSEILETVPSRGSLERALAGAFSGALDAREQSCYELPQAVLDRARRLESEKYSCIDWVGEGLSVEH